MAKKSQKRKKIQLIKEMQKEQAKLRSLKELEAESEPVILQETIQEQPKEQTERIKRPKPKKIPSAKSKKRPRSKSFFGESMFDDHDISYEGIDPQKLGAMLDASRAALESTTKQMLEQLDPTAQAYLLLSDKLEERRKKIKVDLQGKITPFTQEVDQKLRDIVKESKDANLKQLKQHAKRVADLKSIIDASGGTISDEEQKYLEESLGDVSSQIQTHKKKEGSLVGRVGKSLSSQGLSAGAMLAGAFTENPLMTFIGGAMMDFINTTKEERKQQAEERVSEMSDLRNILREQTENIESKFDSSKTDELMAEMVFEQKATREATEQSFEFQKDAQRQQERRVEIQDKMQRLQGRRGIESEQREKDSMSITERLASFLVAREAVTLARTAATTAAGAAAGTATGVGAAAGGAGLLYWLRKKIPGMKMFGQMGSVKGAAKGMSKMALPLLAISEGMDMLGHTTQSGFTEGMGKYLGGVDLHTGERRGTVSNVIDKALTGSAVGAAAGAPFAGVGALPGALIGGLLGGGTGLVSSLFGRKNASSTAATDGSVEIVDRNGYSIGEPMMMQLEESNQSLKEINTHLEKIEKESKFNQLQKILQFDPILGPLTRQMKKPTMDEFRTGLQMVPGGRAITSILPKSKSSEQQRQRIPNDIGATTRKHETGHSDPMQAAAIISTGGGDRGGKSYGAFQLASRTGTLQKFLESSGYEKEFDGLTIGTPEFDQRWKQLAQNPDFYAAQSKFITQTHYSPLINRLEKSGVGLQDRSKAVQEMLYSVGTQYGERLGQQIVQESLQGEDLESLSDKEIVQRVQKHRGDTVDRYFPSSSPGVRQSVQKRAEREKQDLLAMLHEDSGSQRQMVQQEKQRNLQENSKQLALNQSQPTTITNFVAPTGQANSMGNTMVEGNAQSVMGITRNPESIFHSLIKSQYWYTQS